MIGQSVVVGADGSTEARDAALFGHRVTEASGGRLHLIAAAEELSVEVAALRARVSIERVQEALISRARERALSSLESVLGRREIEQLLGVRIGRPEHVLAEAGRELGADLFVLGGRRRRGPGSWLDRGTAHHLLRAAERPVVVTSPSGNFVERVLAAVDLSFATQPTLSVASRLAQLLAVPLSVLHVVRWPDLPRGARVDMEIDPPGPELERAAEHELRAMIPPSLPLSVHRGEPMPLIRRAVEEGPRTLLVVGAQGRGWIDRLLLGSTTEAVLAELPCTLAVVPSSPDSSASPG